MISDEELRSKLVSYGIDVGPIDDSTRNLYLSLLKRREGEQKKARGGRSSYTPEAKKSARSSTGGRSPVKSPPSPPLENDEEEDVSPVRASSRRSTKSSAATVSPILPTTSLRKSRSTPKSLQPTQKLTSVPTPTTDYSSNGGHSGSRSTNNNNNNNNYISSATYPRNNLYSPAASSSSSPSYVHSRATSSHDSMYSNGYLRRPLHPSRYNANENGFSDNDTDDIDSHSRYLSRPAYSPTNGSSRNYSSGSLSSSSLIHPSQIYTTQATPPPRRRGPSSHFDRPNVRGACKPHMIPKIILSVALLFFVGIIISYSTINQKSIMNNLSPLLQYVQSTRLLTPKSSEPTQPVFNFTPCVPHGEAKDADLAPREGYDCVYETLLPPSQDALRKVQNTLTIRNYEMMCAWHGTSAEDALMGTMMTYSDARELIESTEELDKERVLSTMIYLIKENPSYGMEIHRPEVVDYIKLSGYTPPFMCRVYRVVHAMLLQILTFFATVLAIALGYYLAQRRNEKNRERKRQINGIVEDIVDLLTNNAADNPDTPYLAIVHIRNKLVPNAARSRSDMNLWLESEKQFKNTESARVSLERKMIDGEWFEVWTWLPPPNAGATGAKVWQGKAFDGATCQALTTCLKIKNMFDRNEERGDSWNEDVKAAIIEKCGSSHGIVHMHVADDSNEGLVYAKMMSLQHAGKVHKTLHGSWFGGRLVTAKYLREERYHEKFPDSVNLVTQMSL